MADAAQPGSVSFDVPKDVVDAIQKLASGREVRLSGEMRKGKLVIDNLSFAKQGEPYPTTTFVAVNAPFKTCAA